MYIICRRGGYFILLLLVTGLTPLYFLNFSCILFSTYDILVVREVDITPRYNTGASTSFIFLAYYLVLMIY